MTVVDYLMPAAVILVAVLGWISSWIFFLRGKMVEKRELDTAKTDLVREIGTLQERTMAGIAELRADVREIRHDVKTLLSR
ncbi:MAG: hypothetical protein F4X08_06325 [Gemmatimonadetes bacterium]|nr:hypothetical protein [Gemmatimonadota bacterium]MYI98284.1 hypothetical protein [Gemmatimonadota bacterium]